MDLNRFLPCDSVLPHHGVLLGVDFTRPGFVAVPMVVYSGLLRSVTEAHLEQAKITLVHPGTLAALKARLDEIGAGTDLLYEPPVAKEGPSVEGCSVTGADFVGQHKWLRAEAQPYQFICEWCGEHHGENPDYRPPAIPDHDVEEDYDEDWY